MRTSSSRDCRPRCSFDSGRARHRGGLRSLCRRHRDPPCWNALSSSIAPAETGARIIVPTGALAAFDAVQCRQPTAPSTRLVMATRKPPARPGQSAVCGRARASILSEPVGADVPVFRLRPGCRCEISGQRQRGRGAQPGRPRARQHVLRNLGGPGGRSRNTHSVTLDSGSTHLRIHHRRRADRGESCHRQADAAWP